MTHNSRKQYPQKVQEALSSGKQILFFDGICNYCSWLVGFVMPRDKNSTFMYASLQSEAGQWLLKSQGKGSGELDTLYLVSKEGIEQRSSAALQVVRYLSLPWSLLGLFWIVPNFVRDWVYDLVAKNLYRIFGKTETCYLPKEGEKGRFLEEL